MALGPRSRKSSKAVRSSAAWTVAAVCLLPAVAFAGVALVRTPDPAPVDTKPATDPAAYQPCLDYYQVGPSSKCQPPAPKQKAQPAAAPTPTPTVVAAPPAQPVSPTKSKQDEAIDKFQEQYGKPPREFVAFYLNPTPENATKWVHTYQELLNRSTQLAIAWTQAETLYQNALNKGVPASKFASTTLPAVPDYGIPVPGFTDNPAFYPGRQAPGAPIAQAGIQGFGGQAAVPQLAALTNPASVAAGLVTMPQQKAVNAGPIELRYYFSAECPYCQKFEPEFAGLLKEMGNKLSTVCIDVTPYSGPGTGPSQSHVADRLDCAWRTLEPGEEDQFGVKQTPTLIIRRAGASAFERIGGYVPAASLKSYLFGGGQSGLQITDAPIR